MQEPYGKGLATRPDPESLFREANVPPARRDLLRFA